MKKFSYILVVISLIFVACSSLWGASELTGEQTLTPEPVSISTPSKTHESTATVVPSPTITYTPTIVPTPIGGQKLTIAYLSFDCEIVESERCVMIADFFTHQVMDRIPITSEADSINLIWSPDGRYLIYTNVMKNIMHIMLYDRVLSSSTEIDTQLYMNPTSESGMVTRPYPNQVYPEWSPDSKYFAYHVRPYTRNVYSIETGEISLFPTETGYYYWLDDSENIVEIESGIISNVITGQQSRVPKAFMMDIRLEDEYVILREGDTTTWAHKVYLLPYVSDLETLQEKGMQAFLENKLYFAYADDNDKQDTSLQMFDVFVKGKKIIFSGALTRTKPYDRQTFIRFEKMSDMPFHIEIDKETGYDRDNETLLMISPDETMYFTMDTIWDENLIISSLLHSYSMDDHEMIYTYDLHGMAGDRHDITYSRYHNLAFYWEE